MITPIILPQSQDRFESREGTPRNQFRPITLFVINVDLTSGGGISCTLGGDPSFLESLVQRVREHLSGAIVRSGSSVNLQLNEPSDLEEIGEPVVMQALNDYVGNEVT